LASSRRPCHHHFRVLANHATLPLRPELQQCTNASPRAHLRQGRWILFSISYGTPRRGLMERVRIPPSRGAPILPRFNPYARHWWGSKLTHPPKGSIIPSCSNDLHQSAMGEGELADIHEGALLPCCFYNFFLSNLYLFPIPSSNSSNPFNTQSRHFPQVSHHV
jgi:hypothetical protein